MNIILASTNHLPQLINGKVCIIEEDKYTLLNPSRNTTIEDNFNPIEYSILIHPKYNRCIVYSNNSEKTDYLVNERYKQLTSSKKPDLFRTGDKIHIYSRRGIYEILKITTNLIEITCNKWSYTDKKSINIPKEDFKCLAGGLHNYAE